MAAGSVPQEIIVPNTDPSLSYFPQSADWVILTDGSRYQDGDLWLCGNRSASILFTFSGTYFSYNGGMNVDHGQYSVSLDGKQVASLNGYSPDWLHVQSLYNQGVDPGPHTVQISNLDDTGKIIVLDYFSYRPVVREVQNALDVTVASSDDTIMYQPAAQWEQSGIVAQTTHAGASASFPFTGEHIWYYADMGEDHGAFSITIAGTAANFSAFATSPQPVQLLFDRALDPGQYTITITNLEEGKVAGLGHVLYRPSSPSTSTDSQQTTTPSPTPRHVSPGAVVGIAVACTAIAVGAVVGIVIWVLYRRRKRRQMVAPSVHARVQHDRNQYVMRWPPDVRPKAEVQAAPRRAALHLPSYTEAVSPSNSGDGAVYPYPWPVA